MDEILRARLGKEYPTKGVGRNWTDRFVERHHLELKTYNPKSLEGAWGRAVNPTTHQAWFDLLGETLQSGNNGKPIAEDCIWAADEAGFQPAIRTLQEQVIGGANKKLQHQTRGGTRENTTVIVTIGADGSSLPPAVIFKGQAYQTAWKQENPANAS